MLKKDNSLIEENEKLKALVKFQANIIEAYRKRKIKYENIIITKAISLDRFINKNKEKEDCKTLEEDDLEL